MSLWLEDWAVWGFQLTWGFNGLAGLSISADWVHLGDSIDRFKWTGCFFFVFQWTSSFGVFQWTGWLGGIFSGLGGFKSVLSGLYC